MYVVKLLKESINIEVTNMTPIFNHTISLSFADTNISKRSAPEPLMTGGFSGRDAIRDWSAFFMWSLFTLMKQNID